MFRIGFFISILLYIIHSKTLKRKKKEETNIARLLRVTFSLLLSFPRVLFKFAKQMYCTAKQKRYNKTDQRKKMYLAIATIPKKHYWVMNGKESFRIQTMEEKISFVFETKKELNRWIKKNLTGKFTLEIIDKTKNEKIKELKMNKTITLAIRLDEETAFKLGEMWAKEGISKGKLVRIAINRLYRDYINQKQIEKAEEMTPKEKNRWDEICEILNTPWIPENN